MKTLVRIIYKLNFKKFYPIARKKIVHSVVIGIVHSLCCPRVEPLYGALTKFKDNLGLYLVATTSQNIFYYNPVSFMNIL